MDNLVLGADRAQYCVALQPAFINDAAADASLARPLPVFLPGDLNVLAPNPYLQVPYALVSMGGYMKGGAPGGILAAPHDATIIGDSGGYQFIKRPELYAGPKTARDSLLWLERHSALAMTLDIPTRSLGNGRWHTFSDCLDDTLVNLREFEAHRSSSATAFLNVLQGGTRAECRQWLKAVRPFRFEGWAFGGGSRDLPTMLWLILRLIDHGELGRHLHVLGSSTPERAVTLTALKQALSRAGLDVEITFDTSNPSFLMAKSLMVSWLQSGFTIGTARFPASPSGKSSDLPFPITETAVGSRLALRDFCVREGLAQNGMDRVGNLLLTHHNLHQTLRLLEQANRLADLQPYGAELPSRVLKNLAVIEGFLDRPDLIHRSVAEPPEPV